MKQAITNKEGILVVEDEPGIARVCARTLGAEGFQVEVAPDGKAALQVLSEKEFAFILIDVKTPEMSGIKLYRHLQNIYPDLVNRVVFTTGDILSGDIKKFLDESTRPCLSKPFTPNELRAIVKSVLAGKE